MRVILNCSFDSTAPEAAKGFFGFIEKFQGKA
jgi:hypothetical protein